jgi:hypothetical protein
MINYTATTTPVALEPISTAQYATVALNGVDQVLFYIHIQAHFLDDMQPRLEAIKQDIDTPSIKKTY